MTAISLPSRPPLRGSLTRGTDLKEAFQISYVRAIVAAAGAVIVGTPEIDEGVDLMVSHTSDSHSAVPERKAYLEVQLKATHTGDVGQAAAATLRQDRYDYYATPTPTIHKIVVVMRVPKSVDEWLSADHGSLQLKHCAYWVNLAGHTPASGATKSVTAPLNQVFDDVALCDMMERIGRGGAP